MQAATNSLVAALGGPLPQWGNMNLDEEDSDGGSGSWGAEVPASPCRHDRDTGVTAACAAEVAKEEANDANERPAKSKAVKKKVTTAPKTHGGGAGCTAV